MRLTRFVERVITCAALSLATLSAAACHLASTNSSAQPARVDTLWYATARLRQGERLAFRFADSLEYGYYRISSKMDADFMRGNIDMRVIDSARVTRAKFLQSISAPSKDSSDVVVLSVHGYATSHTKAIRDAGEAYLRSGTKARWVAFSWPSSGHGMNLMQPGQMFMTGAYRADSAVAVKSKPAFARLLLAIHGAIGGQRLVLTTHSLGTQLATETLTGDSSVRAALTRSPLRAIGFFEPDISTSRFREYTVPQIRAMSKRIALYASRNDGMLRFSTLINRGDRAGLLGSGTSLLDGAEIIDVTSGITSENWIRRHFGTHHAMKKETSALHDFFDIVVEQRPSECRVKAGSAEAAGDGVWKLLSEVADLSRC